MSKYGQIVKTDAELKPCPFCGGKGVLILVDHRFYVTCDTCTCRVAGPFERENTAAEAVAAWNERDHHRGDEAMEAGEYVYGYDGNSGHWLTGEKIVRCRDCEFAAYEGKECMRIDEWDSSLWFPVEPDGFCAWGEKAVSE